MLKTVLLQKIKPYRRVNKKGFTLMEMLIVVAIIAILIAVAIPVFSAQLHKARVATDWANLRSFYADIQTDYMTKPESPRRLALKQRLRLAFGDVFERTESQNESRPLRGEFYKR